MRLLPTAPSALVCPTALAPLRYPRYAAVLCALLSALCALPAGAAGPAPANALPAVAAVTLPAYQLDPVHTRVLLAVDHAGFSKALGTVSGSTGTLRFDPQAWAQASLRVSVPVARLELGDAAWNKAVLAGNLLHAARYPTAEFVSTRVVPAGAGHAAVYGMLTLHGVSKEIVLEVTLNALKRHPLPPFRRTVGFSATAQLSRKAFGITAWPGVIGDAVELRIEAEATRTRADGAGSDAEADTADAAQATRATDSTATEPPQRPSSAPTSP